MTKRFRAATCTLLGAPWVLAAGWPVMAAAGSVDRPIARTAFENAVRQAIVN